MRDRKIERESEWDTERDEIEILREENYKELKKKGEKKSVIEWEEGSMSSRQGRFRSFSKDSLSQVFGCRKSHNI